MELLFKEKKYKDALEAYETEENQKNWDVFLHYLGKDKKFNEFFVDYLIIKNDFLSLYWFLSNLFESSKENDKENNEVLLELINRFYLSNTIYPSNKKN